MILANSKRQKLALLCIQYREREGITQKELGSRLGFSGTTVSIIENPRGKPGADSVQRVLDFFDMKFL